MSQNMKRIGFGATVLIVVLLSFNMLREPFRQRDTLTEHEQAAIDRAIVTYATNCVECHGAFGEGLNNALPLNNRDTRRKTHDELFLTISRGKASTSMAAFHIDEGGALTTPQIDDLITLIQKGSWRDVQAYVEEHGLTPTELPPIEQQFNIAELSYPLEVVSLGRDVYVANCFSCHNPGSTGVAAHNIGKELTDNEFIQDSTDEELIDFVTKGRLATDPANVTGNEMPPRGGNPDLTDDEIAASVAYLRELNNGTALLPTIAAADLNPPGTVDDVTYQWIEVTNNLNSPLGLVNAGDGSGRLFVLEQTGQIWILKDGQINFDQPFLDIADLLPLRVFEGIYTEQGLLGLAFHPDYENNGDFFINYTNTQGDSVVARYRVSADNPDRADPASGVILLTVDQPFEDHNGGDLVFGPDGYLYIGFGDGGRPAEPNYNSQDPQNYLGKMLRIDVNADTYTVPLDNPFVDDPAYLPEIWALGLRNPWRYSFDRETGDLYIGDVGQWHIEEIDFQPASSRGGENYGWSAWEGTEIYLEDETVLGEHTPPILEHIHDEAQSITGGYVYRGQNLPGLWGKYIYGDYIGGLVWVAGRDESGAWQSQLLMDTGFVLSTFGEDEQGELYAVDYKGTIYRLEIVETPEPEITPTPES